MDIKPSQEAYAHSLKLSNLITKEMDQFGGSIPFSRYMDLALYSPGLGYYAAGANKLGPAGDFTTAPEISPWFGATIARSIRPSLEALKQKYQVSQILEFGAGSGALAKSILEQFHRDSIELDTYYILDVSPDLKDRQKKLLLPFLESIQSKTQLIWLEQLPSNFTGVMLANEVIDAFPVELIVKRQTGWHYRHVTTSQTSTHHPIWDWTDGPLVPAAHLPNELLNVQDQLPIGYQTEIHPQAQAWISSVAHTLKEGVFLTFDYGFPGREYYHPQRSSGTLMAHFAHRATPDPFYLPGLCDLTAHVEWTTLAQTALAQGLECIGYQSQAAFLLNAGIGELLLENLDPREPSLFLPHSNAIQKLLSEAEMGELFKAIGFRKVVDENSELAQIFDQLPGFKGRLRVL